MITPLIIILVMALLAMIIMFSLLYSAVRYVPFVPTEGTVIRQMIEAAQLRDGQNVLDLGCGDGRVLMAALQKRDIQATGIEINPLISFFARFRLRMRGMKAKIIHGNFFALSLREADVIFCYLFPRVMQRLEQKFTAELRRGSTVVSYCFPIKAWKPTKVIQTRTDKPKNFLIYVYRMPCQTS